MTRALVYSRRAQADLDDIFDFIAADNPVRAIRSQNFAAFGSELTNLLGHARA